MDWSTGSDTTEVVAEYAVDMRFGITVASQISNKFAKRRSVAISAGERCE